MTTPPPRFYDQPPRPHIRPHSRTPETLHCHARPDAVVDNIIAATDAIETAHAAGHATDAQLARACHLASSLIQRLTHIRRHKAN